MVKKNNGNNTNKNKPQRTSPLESGMHHMEINKEETGNKEDNNKATPTGLAPTPDPTLWVLHVSKHTLLAPPVILLPATTNKS